MRPALFVTLAACLCGTTAVQPAAADIRIEAPATLASAARRLDTIDRSRLDGDLARANLALPDTVTVSLIDSADPRAARTPAWIVGLAFGTDTVVIFPERVMAYPYDSLESVLRHELTHVALSARAGDSRLPRWFHEGVAVSVDAGWDLSSRLQLLLAMRSDLRVADLDRRFASEAPSDIDLAYRLAAALVDDLRRRHAPGIPGTIAGHVAMGRSFDDAFRLATGETPDAAAARAWGFYRQWNNWVTALTSPSVPWAIVLGLAVIAFVTRVRQRRRKRRQWQAEDDDLLSPPG